MNVEGGVTEDDFHEFVEEEYRRIMYEKYREEYEAPTFIYPTFFEQLEFVKGNHVMMQIEELAKLISKPSELKYITHIDFEDDKKTIIYGNEVYGTKRSVTNLSKEQIQEVLQTTELSFQDNTLELNKYQDKLNLCNADNYWIPSLNRSISQIRLFMEIEEKILIPFYKYHLANQYYNTNKDK